MSGEIKRQARFYRLYDFNTAPSAAVLFPHIR
jgi:hypothetical protein